MTVIVLCGCDAVGKSTFAGELSKRTGFEIHRGSSFQIAELGPEGMYNHMMFLLNKRNIIIDRFYFSNIVYGQLFNYPMMEDWQFESLRNKLNKTGMVIYLYTDEKTIVERLNSRGDEEVESKDIAGILDMYRNTMHGKYSPETMISLETSDSNFSIATSMIADMIDSDMTKTYLKM